MKRAEWIFIADQLNTHQSEGLVRLVAELCQLEVDLGIKGKSGILKSIKGVCRCYADATLCLTRLNLNASFKYPLMIGCGCSAEELICGRNRHPTK